MLTQAARLNGLNIETRLGPKGELTQVRLNLTPAEWCEICQDTGADWLGEHPAQRILQLAFAQSGWLTLTQLRSLVRLLSREKEFEELACRPSMWNCMQGWIEQLQVLWYVLS